MQMSVRLVATEAARAIPAAPHPFLAPPELFRPETPGEPLFWTCVRTRPRWEKRFASWLRQHQFSFFLPVMPHLTTGGRKRRMSEIPIFPGFVFVNGRYGKGDFDRTGIVVYVLHPQIPHMVEQLHTELWSVWCGLASGRFVSPVQNLTAGEPCEIIRGPLQGLKARFERMGRQGRLVLQVELMGGGLSVEVGDDEVDVLA